MTDKIKEGKKEEIKLTKEELQIIINVLFGSRWTGQEWEGTIKPLINKLAKMADLVEL